MGSYRDNGKTYGSSLLSSVQRRDQSWAGPAKLMPRRAKNQDSRMIDYRDGSLMRRREGETR